MAGQPKVTLYWVCKTLDGWKRYRAAIGRNGKIRPRHAQIGKTQQLIEQGHYECRFRAEDGKTIWKNVGEDASLAQAEQLHISRILTAQVAAEDAGTKIVEIPNRVNLKLKSQEFIERQIARGKKRAAVLFGTAIDEFLPIVKVQFADQLTEAIIMRWYVVLRGKNSDRTIYNKHMFVFQFLNWVGLDTAKLAIKAPTYTQKTVETYTTSEMTAFFNSLTDPYQLMVFGLLLKTGLRMQEAMYLQWHQIDLRRGTLTVMEHNNAGFTIKDKAERTLPIPTSLIEQLKVWNENHGGTLVLGTGNDTPNTKWLPVLKRLVHKAGLNCGHCVGCVEHQECERWYLHKFRATYTTNLLRAGIDARTVMQYTGHSDLATVMRYLSPAELPDTQTKINSISWGV